MCGYALLCMQYCCTAELRGSSNFTTHFSSLKIPAPLYTSAHSTVIMLLVFVLTVYDLLQIKCEQYWHDQVDRPFNAGRDITVVTTAYRGFADYDVRDLTVQSVS